MKSNKWIYSLWLTRPRLKPMIYQSWGDHANNYTTNELSFDHVKHWMFIQTYLWTWQEHWRFCRVTSHTFYCICVTWNRSVCVKEAFCALLTTLSLKWQCIYMKVVKWSGGYCYWYCKLLFKCPNTCWEASKVKQQLSPTAILFTAIYLYSHNQITWQIPYIAYW
jgi:hypothetical protein